jgi:hypothetical protein
MRFVLLATALLFAGCLEAADLAEERLVSPETCRVPNGVALCPDAPVLAETP